MTRALGAAALIATVAAVAPATAAAESYGRWRVEASGTIEETWNSSSTVPCAITGHGSAHMHLVAKPFVVRLQFTRGTRSVPATWWTGTYRYAVKDLVVHIDATDAAIAVRQPPADPDTTCSWGDPAGFACGARSYDAHVAFGGGPRGIAVERSSHFFDFELANNEPQDHTCYPAASTDLGVLQPRTPRLYPLFHPSREGARKRRPMTMRDRICGDQSSMYDNEPYEAFEVTEHRCRDVRLTLTPVRRTR